MGRYTPFERGFLIASFSIIGLLGVFAVFVALAHKEPIEDTATDSPFPAAEPRSAAPAPPPASPFAEG